MHSTVIAESVPPHILGAAYAVRSVVGFGTLFEIYLSHFLMEHLWAVVLVIFAFAFVINELLAWAERSVRYYAASR